MTISGGIREQIQEELEDRPVDQDELVDDLEDVAEKTEVLNSLRTMMERDEISYTMDWDLQLEE